MRAAEKNVVELAGEPKRGRGRPAKVDGFTAAERARRYREKQKAAGLIKRYVETENAKPTDAEDLAYYIARNKALGELLATAQSTRDFYKSETERLHTENEGLLARAREAEQYGTIKSKELIVMRDKLSALQSQHTGSTETNQNKSRRSKIKAA